MSDQKSVEWKWFDAVVESSTGRRYRVVSRSNWAAPGNPHGLAIGLAAEASGVGMTRMFSADVRDRFTVVSCVETDDRDARAVPLTDDEPDQ